MSRSPEDLGNGARVAVLAHALRVGGGLSVGLNLVAALGRVAPRNDYFVTVPSNAGYDEVCTGLPSCRTLPYRDPGRLLSRWWFETSRLPRLVREFRPDVVLALGNRGLTDPPCPQAIVCQDAHLFYPIRHYGRESLRSILVPLYQAWHMRRVLRTTRSLLLCQTECALRRARAAFSYDGPAALLPNAVSFFLDDPGQLEGAISPALARQEGSFRLFTLAKFYAYKNLEVIPSLFRRHASALTGVQVVTTVAAEHHPNASRFLRDIERPDLENSILNVGPIPHAELAAHYRQVDALFLPTLLESSSGTYLEAMHYGVPILTSNLDFAHEVCGKAALYFDPWDTTSIRDAIVRLRDDVALRRDLVERGRRRLREFARSWDDIAAELNGRLLGLVRPADPLRPR